MSCPRSHSRSNSIREARTWPAVSFSSAADLERLECTGRNDSLAPRPRPCNRGNEERPSWLGRVRYCLFARRPTSGRRKVAPESDYSSVGKNRDVNADGGHGDSPDHCPIADGPGDAPKDGEGKVAVIGSIKISPRKSADENIKLKKPNRARKLFKKLISFQTEETLESTMRRMSRARFLSRRIRIAVRYHLSQRAYRRSVQLNSKWRAKPVLHEYMMHKRDN